MGWEECLPYVQCWMYFSTLPIALWGLASTIFIAQRGKPRFTKTGALSMASPLGSCGAGTQMQQDTLLPEWVHTVCPAFLPPRADASTDLTVQPRQTTKEILPLGSKSLGNSGLKGSAWYTPEPWEHLGTHTLGQRSSFFQQGMSHNAQCAHSGDPQFRLLAHHCWPRSDNTPNKAWAQGRPLWVLDVDTSALVGTPPVHSTGFSGSWHPPFSPTRPEMWSRWHMERHLRKQIQRRHPTAFKLHLSKQN